MIATLFELVPVGLAVVAAVLCAIKAKSEVAPKRRIGFSVGSAASVLLVIAQLSWWGSYVIQGSIQGTWVANVIWTIFNSLAMIALIYLALYKDE